MVRVFAISPCAFPSHQHVYLERNHQVTEKLYYARPIETVYVVGQEIPRMEIPKPSSRRLGNIIKARMMAQAYRMIKESGNRGELDLAKIYKEYPEFVQLHIRQKLRVGRRDEVSL